MASPFPGMDPFIEGQGWESFHTQMIAALQETLSPRVRPNYVVMVEVRVYLERSAPAEQPDVRPDLTVARSTDVSAPLPPSTSKALAPVLLSVPVPEEIHETYLTIRHRVSREVVTVIEVLSPSNKRPGDGRREYLAKREDILRSATHLVELDLLRGGERLPTIQPLPPADFYALICRGNLRPQAEVYPCNLMLPLPAVPIPLGPEEDDVAVDLQTLVNTVYERAGYTWSLDYTAKPVPPLDEAHAAWVRGLLGPT